MLFSQRGQSTSLCPCFEDWMPRRMKRSWRCEWAEEEEAEMRGKKNWKVGVGVFTADLWGLEKKRHGQEFFIHNILSWKLCFVFGRTDPMESLKIFLSPYLCLL